MKLYLLTNVIFLWGKKEPLHDGKKGVTNSIQVNNRGLSRKHIFEAIEGSLKRLQMDYIDLYQIHRWDDETPIEETMKALHDVVQSGKARYIGASTMHAWQFAKAQHVAIINGWTPFVSMQNLYNLVYREEEREMNPLCLDQGIGVIPWSPLQGGYLARPSSDSEPTAREKMESKIQLFTPMNRENSPAVREAVKIIADKRKVSMAEVALAWLLSKEVVTAPIIGVSKMSQLEDAIKAVSLKLTEKEIEALEANYKPRARL